MVVSRFVARSSNARAGALAPPPPGMHVPPRLQARAKLFANGRSQAVRLPKEFRLPGAEVLVRRDGARLVLEPIDAKGWPVGLWDRLDALADGLEDDWERPPHAPPPPLATQRHLSPTARSPR